MLQRIALVLNLPFSVMSFKIVVARRWLKGSLSSLSSLKRYVNIRTLVPVPADVPPSASPRCSLA